MRSIFRDKKAFVQVISLTLLLFSICMIYCILRNLKDAVTLTSQTAGAEVIPFIKVWCMLPTAIFMAWFVTKLSRTFERNTCFYILISIFLSYYMLFVFVIFPNREVLALDRVADFLTGVLPVGLRGLISIIRNWHMTLFYVMSEAWATVIITVSFWGFVNEISSSKDAENHYGIFKLGSTLSALTAGGFALFITSTQYNPNLPFGNTVWEQTLIKLALTVLVLGIFSMLLFRGIYNSSLSKEKRAQKGGHISVKKKKKMALIDSLKYVLSSPYLSSIAMLVLGYFVVFSLSDLVWKSLVRAQYPNPNDLVSFMNRVTMMVGGVSIVAALLTPLIVKRLGWTFLALIAPVAILVASTGFFSFQFWGHKLSGLALFLGATPLMMSVGFGAVQNFIGKAVKYSVFDVSKEMAFTPLDPDVKWKGKTSIDGIGTDLGKTGASLANQGLIILCGNIALAMPYTAAIIFVMLGLWIVSATYIGKKYKIMKDAAEKLPGA